MYSIRMSSITATESGAGDGSSPKAYISGFTLISPLRRRGITVFLKEILFSGVTTGHLLHS